MASGQTAQSNVNAEIQKLEREFERHAANKDIPGLVEAFYAEDATLLPPNNPPATGKPKIREFLQGLIDAGLTGLKLETVQVDSSGDLAYNTGKYSLRIGPNEDNGKYVVVYRRQADGSLKAVADMFSSNQGLS